MILHTRIHIEGGFTEEFQVHYGALFVIRFDRKTIGSWTRKEYENYLEQSAEIRSSMWLKKLFAMLMVTSLSNLFIGHAVWNVAVTN